jgi:hypothetical protein
MWKWDISFVVIADAPANETPFDIVSQL